MVVDDGLGDPMQFLGSVYQGCSSVRFCLQWWQLDVLCSEEHDHTGLRGVDRRCSTAIDCDLDAHVPHARDPHVQVPLVRDPLADDLHARVLRVRGFLAHGLVFRGHHDRDYCRADRPVRGSVDRILRHHPHHKFL